MPLGNPRSVSLNGSCTEQEYIWFRGGDLNGLHIVRHSEFLKYKCPCGQI